MTVDSRTAEKLTVIVNGDPVRVWPWCTWRDAVTAWHAEAGVRLGRGESWIEDALGNAVDSGGAVVDGASIHVRETSGK